MMFTLIIISGDDLDSTFAAVDCIVCLYLGHQLMSLLTLLSCSSLVWRLDLSHFGANKLNFVMWLYYAVRPLKYWNPIIFYSYSSSSARWSSRHTS